MATNAGVEPCPFFPPLFLFFFFFAKAVEQQVAISAASDSFAVDGGHLFCHAPPWLLQGFFFSFVSVEPASSGLSPECESS